MCNAVLDNFSLLISHFKRVHRQDPNFLALCGINGCGKTYKALQILQIAREVRQPQDLAQDVEIEEPVGDVFTRQPLSDEDEDNPPGCTAQEH